MDYITVAFDRDKHNCPRRGLILRSPTQHYNQACTNRMLLYVKKDYMRLAFRAEIMLWTSSSSSLLRSNKSDTQSDKRAESELYGPSLHPL